MNAITRHAGDEPSFLWRHMKTIAGLRVQVVEDMEFATVRAGKIA
jgi:hypothetical protein